MITDIQNKSTENTVARLYGLVGYPLGHSYSQLYYRKHIEKNAISADYLNFPLPTLDAIPELIVTKKNLCGLNITIPYKRQIIPLLLSDPRFSVILSEEVCKTHAANTLNITRKEENIHIDLYNTDVYGFRYALSQLLQQASVRSSIQYKTALIFGNGGASQAINQGLSDMGIFATIVSRTPQVGMLAYSEVTAKLIQETPLLINTTPLGTPQYEGEFPPISYEAITPVHILFDIICHPQLTPFLQKGEQRGAITSNGLSMLCSQAEKNIEIWQL